MANKKDIIIAILATFCLASAFFMILPSKSDPYDAWRDINDDGKIDMKDIGYTVKSFGTSGDSTKNVTVTNWPESSDVSVWYGYSLGQGVSIMSGYYHSYGYSKLHMLIRISGLGSGESIQCGVFAHLYNATHTIFANIYAYSQTFNQTSYSAAVTIDVPSEEFQFYLMEDAFTSCTIYLSFYLTWA